MSFLLRSVVQEFLEFIWEVILDFTFRDIVWMVHEILSLRHAKNQEKACPKWRSDSQEWIPKDWIFREIRNLQVLSHKELWFNLWLGIHDSYVDWNLYCMAGPHNRKIHNEIHLSFGLEISFNNSTWKMKRKIINKRDFLNLRTYLLAVTLCKMRLIMRKWR